MPAMMRRPENCIYIIQGELNLLVTALRRSHRWLTHNHQDDDQDPLVSSFSKLKDLLNAVTDLSEISPNEVLGPFLEVIRSEETTGPITGMALGSINKFLSYGFIDPSCDTATAAIENVADAVTHARFVGTDPNSDEVVLMKILHVLRTMLLTEAGVLLTNESVCEIMQSCFRICFEMRLSELLRKSAEHTLMDMVQVLFSRLPEFKEDSKWFVNMKKLKMRASGMDPTHNNKYKKRSPKPKQKKIQGGAPGHGATHPTAHSDSPSQCATQPPGEQEKCGTSELMNRVAPSDADKPLAGAMSDVEATLERSEVIATTPVAGTKTVVDIQTSFQRAADDDALQDSISYTNGQSVVDPDTGGQPSVDGDRQDSIQGGPPQVIGDVTLVTGDTSEGYVAGMDTCPVTLSPDGTESNTLQTPTDTKTSVGGDMDTPGTDGEEGVSTPREGSIPPPSPSVGHESDYVNPRGVRFTSHHRGSGPPIPYGLPCVRELFRFLMSLTNPLDRQNTDVMVHMGLSLLTVTLEAGADHISKFNSLLYLIKDDMCRNLFFLLQSDRLSLFAAAIRVCFLLFECMRSHLKFQLEMYLNKLIDIIVSDSPRISYEQREIALDSIVQLLRIPGLVTELYLNYDCDLYSSSLFEDLMKLLSKNAFPVSGLFTTHLLSLDALLAVIDSIEQHCHHVMVHGTGPGTDHTKLTGTAASFDGQTEDRSERNTPSPTPLPCHAGNKGTGTDLEGSKMKTKETRSIRPKVRPNRMRVSSEIPAADVLAAIKQKKKVYHMGTELFNQKPSKGIAYLQEHGLLATPLDPSEVVVFIKENHKLDKKQIGEFVSSRKNEPILVAFLRSFNFEDTRIDESLRMLLESFRLPGEAPVISYILEHFADHWQKMTGETFVNADAAFTLAYAVIMLNVDQHNTNAKKQNVPMTSREFKKNVKGVNGGGDFDQDMLEEIYNAIKAEEIVMPAEQTGLVKENYLWKMLLRRGATSEGRFLHVPTGMFDHDLFALVWGPTVAALSFVFDKSSDEAIILKAVSGFRKCATISAHYGMSDVFDNLVISLCKFTTLLSSAESADMIPVQFGNNSKAQLSARTVFGLAHRHGDILRDGWKNILDCILQLYRAKLLPDLLVKVEDFVDPNGKISLIREETPSTQRNDTGVLSSFYSYFTLAESMPQRGPAPEEQDAIHRAQTCILDCHIDQLITETKFLPADSLAELLKALLGASRCPEVQETMNGTLCDEDSTVFFLELLIRVVLQNRDRIGPFWQSIRDHVYNIVVNNASTNSFLVERAVVGLLRLAIRLLRRDDLAPQVLASLRVLLMMEPLVIHGVSRQVAFGLHELLKTNAANIHSTSDWYTLFTLLEVVGAGTNPPPLMQVEVGVNVPESIADAGAQSDSEVVSSQPANGSAGMPETTSSDRGYTSDSELYENLSRHGKNTVEMDVKPTKHGSWLLVYNHRDDTENMKRQIPINQYNIALNEELCYHDAKSLIKCCETLAFLVRDAAHITPHNFESCVHAIRTFVEANVNGGHPMRHSPSRQTSGSREKKVFRKHSKREESRMKKSRSSPSHLQHLEDSDEEEGGVDADIYHSLSIQLLDLMHTLHTRAASIFSSWAEEEQRKRSLDGAGGELESTERIDAGASSLWLKCWCPLLQGIARLCCDTRRQVRSQALTYLQRALLVHDLQTLSAVEWESCFNKVLFPLLSKLLDNINPQDPTGIEETRMRASTLLCKVFLQHLSPLLSLSTFTALWLTILEFMDKYMHVDKSDLLCEAIPESLKNMLLVMHTAGILRRQTEDTAQGEEMGEGEEESQLWKLTWDQINSFLPNLHNDVFKPHEIDQRRLVSMTMKENAASDAAGKTTQHTVPPVEPSGGLHHSAVSAPAMTSPQLANSDYRRSDSPNRDATGSPVVTGPSLERLSNSPLTVPMPSLTTSQYILHPPLPNITSPPKMVAGTHQPLASVPILLNPDLMHGTPIPIISSQGTQDGTAQ